MSMMDEYHRTLSGHLGEILDRIGLSAQHRQDKVDTTITINILRSLSEQLVTCGNELAHYVFGSQCEATTTESLQSDIDLVTCDERLPVFDDMNDVPDSGNCFIIVRDSNTAAGYVKLQCVQDGEPMAVGGPALEIHSSMSIDDKGRVMLNHWMLAETARHIKFPNERNGPACTSIHVPFVRSAADCVWAYRCRKWPHYATEWLTRDRRHNWPPQVQIDVLRKMGCLFVAVAHQHSSEQNLEWRTSFSLQERDLMLSLNSVQHRCYVLMKATKRDIMTPLIGDDITSYHCKTVLFYAIETTPAEFWKSENLVKCFLYCLESMWKHVEVGILPNYFIPDANLFDRRLNTDLQSREKVTNMLQSLVAEEGMFLFRIRSDDIGIQLSSASRREESATTIADMQIKYESITNDAAYRRYVGVGSHVIAAVNGMLEAIVPMDDTCTAIKTLEKQLDSLTKSRA